MNPECQSILDLVPAYDGDTLLPAQRSAIRSHLAACDDCRGQAVERDPVLVFARPYEKAGDETLAREILANVRVAIAVRQASEKAVGPRPARRHRYAAGIAAAATVAALLWMRPPHVLRPADARAARPELTEAAPPTEGLTPASATVYEWNPGSDAPDDPKIVWIVDRSLDL